MAKKTLKNVVEVFAVEHKRPAIVMERFETDFKFVLEDTSITHVMPPSRLVR